MDDKTRLAVIEQLEKPGVVKRLYDYAYYLESLINGTLPAAWQPLDIADEAIASFLTGSRTWDRERYPNLIPVMKGMIKSQFFNVLSKENNRRKLLQSRNEEQAIQVDEPAGSSGSMAPMGVNNSKLAKKIESVVEGDNELFDIYSAIIEDYEKPREIAEYLGLDEKQIKTRLQRLRRKCRKNIDLEASS